MNYKKKIEMKAEEKKLDSLFFFIEIDKACINIKKLHFNNSLK